MSKNRGSRHGFHPSKHIAPNLGKKIAMNIGNLSQGASSIEEAIAKFKAMNANGGAAGVVANSSQPIVGNARITPNQISESDLQKKVLIPTPTDTSPSLYKEVTLPKLGKNIKVSLADKVQIIGFPGDFSGCGHFRMIYPFTMANAKFARTGKILFSTAGHHITQEDVLLNVRTLWFQRPASRQALQMIESYKRHQGSYKYKLVAEVDDYVFEIPDYNTSKVFSKIESSSNTKNAFKMVDEIVTTTPMLAKEISEVCDVPMDKIRIIPNYLPRSMYTTDTDRTIKEDIKKPRILYNGSGTHYDNENKKHGDLDGNIYEFIMKYNEKYDIVFMGGHPWFVNDLVNSGKITSIPWLDSYEYPMALRRIQSNFTIMPLKNNIFNRCKSDIKYLEACATGSVAIGSKFSGSPYENINLTFNENTSPEELASMIDEYSTVDKHNEILAKQSAFMSNRWMDSINNIMQYVYASTQGCHGWAIDEDHPDWNQFKHLM